MYQGQLQNNWCSGATVQQTLMYINGTSPSQSTIMNAVGAGPSLNTVLDYLNIKQTKNIYIRTYCSTKADFDARLAYSAYYYSPMIFTLKSTGNNWPYSTNGTLRIAMVILGATIYSQTHFILIIGQVFQYRNPDT